MIRFSLHRTRKTEKRCQICDDMIPVRKRPDYAEYWKVAGGRRCKHIPRIICCMCHALFGFPTNGWVESADGIYTTTAKTPFLTALKENPNGQ